MSNMRFFVGTFEKAVDQTIIPKDVDVLVDLEKVPGCYYVRVEGTLYKAWPVANVEANGFEMVLPVIHTPLLVAYWYSGGASVHEVIKSAIQKYLDENTEPVDDVMQTLTDAGLDVVNLSCPSVRDGSTWECKVGIAPGTPVSLPGGGDLPMRTAIEAAFLQVTGQEPEYCFSGWGAELDEAEKSVLP